MDTLCAGILASQDKMVRIYLFQVKRVKKLVVG
jgi:hypothetical protein